ncbi:hypothetical protein N7510_011250 [Penicillium lagena]|uniref:uncharacterized protein n=1 Tax=Penicillium lagena TaxID=94218 RepID=UPI0025404D0E|nr:uncharacterized protein N7510_011250 [Penicillium lagena]KAJ5601716.1 hypothetical protein N7510_011250 [Penicillium lagena]
MDLVFKGPNPAKFPALRKDIWDSREKAESALRRGLSKWDPRVAERYLRYGLRAVPTRLYNKQSHPALSENAVTLTTTKHHESWGYTTPNLEPESAGLDRLLLPDWDVEKERPYAFSRPECWSSMRNLPFLRPSVLWVFGENSYVSSREMEDEKMRVTGTGPGGSGGAAKGMVEKALLEKAGHNLILEEVDRSAKVGADWIGRWFRGWLADEEFWNNYQSKRSDAEMLRLSDAAFKVSQMLNGDLRVQGKL